MNIKKLGLYDKVVIWGIGENFFKNYQYQFRADFLFDKNPPVGEKPVLKIPFVSMEALSDICEKNSVLIVIASSKYYEDIAEEIRVNKLCCDIVKMNDLLAVYGFQHKSLCLWGLDALVKDILQRGGRRIQDMSYIEIGANHPIHGSATEIFYLLGARGILIEPNPDCMAMLQKLRPEDKCINCGIGKEKGIMRFYRFDNSYRDSFDYGEVEKNIARGYRLLDEIDVPVVSIDDIIRQYKVNTAKTYLSIQVMGSELDVLNGFSYQEHDFPVIQLAYYHEEVLKHGLFNEYKEIARVPKHIVLVKQELYDSIFSFK